MLLDSFKLHNLVFQVQYENAYALWDGAGAIAQKLSDIWPNLALHEGQPNQQTLTGDGVQIQSGLNTSTVTISNSKALDAHHAQLLMKTFEVWQSELMLTKLKRLSTRIVFEKNFPTIGEANAFFLGREIVKWPTSKVFDQSLDAGQNGIDLQFRFEDEKSFSVLRVRAEKLKMDVNLDPYFFEEAKLSKEKNRSVIDFDRGLLGSVDATTVRVDEWLKGVHHILRRDLEKVIKA